MNAEGRKQKAECNSRPEREQFLDGGNLIGTLGHSFRAKPAPVAHRVGAGNLQALAVEPFLAVNSHTVPLRVAFAQHVVLPFQQRRFELARVEVAEQSEAGGLAGRPVASMPTGPVAGETATKTPCP